MTMPVSAQGAIDWSRYMEGLQGKANTDLNNLSATGKTNLGMSRVVEQKINSDGSFYRKYSNGWLEQGGTIASFADNWTLTFPKPFKNGNYMLQGEQWGTDASGNLGINEQQSTFAKGNHIGSGNMKATWYACGQGA